MFSFVFCEAKVSRNVDLLKSAINSASPDVARRMDISGLMIEVCKVGSS